MTAAWQQVDEILQTGLDSGVYTAAVFLAGREGEVIHQRAVGRLSRAAKSPETINRLEACSTIFNLTALWDGPM